MSAYLDEALRACRLPIRVYVDEDNWIHVCKDGHHVVSWDAKQMTQYYVGIRNRLLAEQKEKE